MEQIAVSLLGIGAFMSLTFPLEMIRTRMQTVPELTRQKLLSRPYDGIADCVRTIARDQGIYAFWKGNMANLLRVFPNEASNFFIKESIQIVAKRNNLVSSDNVSINFISGAIGSVINTALFYPLDFCRARLNNDVKGNMSITKFIVKTYKVQGLKGIYRGSLNFLLSGIIYRGLFFGVFDTMKNIDPGNKKMRVVSSYISVMTAIYSVYFCDTIRKRMMMTSGQNYKYGGFADCALQIYRNEGLASFYKGWQLSLGQGAAFALLLFVLDEMATSLKNQKSI